MGGEHEIKGSAFITLARWFTETRRIHGWSEMLAHLDERDRLTVEGALASEWYPEALHGRVLEALFVVTAQRDYARFEAIVDACTLLGVQTFARLVLSMSSPAFVLRRAPTLWAVIRRGPATLTVEQTEGRSRLRYRQFPFFADELYRLYFKGLLTALVRPTLKRPPQVKIVSFSADSLDIEIEHG